MSTPSLAASRARPTTRSECLPTMWFADSFPPRCIYPQPISASRKGAQSSASGFAPLAYIKAIAHPRPSRSGLCTYRPDASLRFGRHEAARHHFCDDRIGSEMGGHDYVVGDIGPSTVLLDGVPYSVEKQARK